MKNLLKVIAVLSKSGDIKDSHVMTDVLTSYGTRRHIHDSLLTLVNYRTVKSCHSDAFITLFAGTVTNLQTFQKLTENRRMPSHLEFMERINFDNVATDTLEQAIKSLGINQ